MSSEIRRSVDILFDDGVTRTVLMNTNAKIEAESAVRQADGTPTPFYRLIHQDGLAPLRALLWAGLRGADKTLRVGREQLTLEAAGELLAQIDHDELALQLFLAVLAADARTTEDERKNAERVARATMQAMGMTAMPAFPPSAATPSDPDNSPTMTISNAPPANCSTSSPTVSGGCASNAGKNAPCAAIPTPNAATSSRILRGGRERLGG